MSFRLKLKQANGLLIAVGIFLLLYGLYSSLHPQGFTASLFGQNANEVFVIIAAAMAQTVPVITGGLDLSIGPMITLVNCLASELLGSSGPGPVVGIGICLLAGTACGVINGGLVVYGRLQPIIATLATGTMFLGAALLLRPTPGGDVDGDLAFAMTFDLNEAMSLLAGRELPGFLSFLGGIPMPFFFAVALVGVWIYYKRTPYGLGAYAVGASSEAAYMSGVRRERVKLAAYAMAGFFSAVGGVYLALQTGSGNADLPQAGAYTLNSIASVVIGGTSLYGGAGGAVGSLFGALALRSVAFNFRVFDSESVLSLLSNPLYQPLFEGLILILAVSVGALPVLRTKNRLLVFR